MDVTEVNNSGCLLNIDKEDYLDVDLNNVTFLLENDLINEFKEIVEIPQRKFRVNFYGETADRLLNQVKIMLFKRQIFACMKFLKILLKKCNKLVNIFICDTDFMNFVFKVYDSDSINVFHMNFLGVLGCCCDNNDVFTLFSIDTNDFVGKFKCIKSGVCVKDAFKYTRKYLEHNISESIVDSIVDKYRCYFDTFSESERYVLIDILEYLYSKDKISSDNNKCIFNKVNSVVNNMSPTLLLDSYIIISIIVRYNGKYLNLDPSVIYNNLLESSDIFITNILSLILSRIRLDDDFMGKIDLGEYLEIFNDMSLTIKQNIYMIITSILINLPISHFFRLYVQILEFDIFQFIHDFTYDSNDFDVLSSSLDALYNLFSLAQNDRNASITFFSLFNKAFPDQEFYFCFHTDDSIIQEKVEKLIVTFFDELT